MPTPFRLHKVICLILLCQLIVPPSLFAQSNDDPQASAQPQPPPPAPLSDSDRQDASAAAQDQAAYLDSLVPTLSEVYVNLLQEAQETERLHGSQKLEYRLERNSIVWKGDFGKGELRRIGGVFVAKVVDAETQEAYLVYDSGTVPVDEAGLAAFNTEFERLVADQHFNAGSSRADGEQGRHCTAVALNGGTFVSKRYPKLKPHTWEYWREWRLATLVPTSPGDFKLGFFSGLLQAGEIVTISTLANLLSNAHLLSSPHMGWHTILINSAFTFLFGLTIGWRLNTYRKFIGRPNGDVNSTDFKGKEGRLARLFTPSVRRAMKSGLISAAYLFPVLYLTSQGQSSVTISTILTSVAMSVGVGFWGKDAWNKANYLDDYLRVDMEEYVLHFLGMEIHTGIPKYKVMNQLRSQIPMLFKFSDNLHLTPSQVTIFGRTFTLPILALMMIWPAKIYNWKKARVKANRLMSDPHDYQNGITANELATQRWNDIFKLPFNGDLRNFPFLNKIYTSIFNTSLWEEPKEPVVIEPTAITGVDETLNPADDTSDMQNFLQATGTDDVAPLDKNTSTLVPPKDDKSCSDTFK